MPDHTADKTPPLPPKFQPSRPDVPWTFDREFSNNGTALAWLQNQGHYFPRLFLCLAENRTGSVVVLNQIECQLYPWGTPANADYHFLHLVWEKMDYFVISVPMQDKERVLTLLEHIPPGFRVNWGEPHQYTSSGTVIHAAWREGAKDPKTVKAVASCPGARCFPLRGDNVGTIEFLRRERGPFIAGYGISSDWDTSIRWTREKPDV